MPVTSSSPAICADSPAATPPVPWVPVEIGAGQGLLGDVAHVVQGEPEALELGVEHVQRGAGQRGHGHRLAVDGDDPAQPRRA